MPTYLQDLSTTNLVRPTNGQRYRTGAATPGAVDTVPVQPRTEPASTALPGLRSWRLTSREHLKIAVRRTLYRRNVELVRNPYMNRLVRLLDAANIDTVLDVGANIGQYASALRSNDYRGVIISLEPLSDAYERLTRRARRDANWFTERTAVGSAKASAQINVAGNSYSSSLLDVTQVHLDIAPAAAAVRTESVDVTTVASLIEAHRIDPTRILLKADTQGFESQVLDGAGALLDRIPAVQLELSLASMYAGDQLMPVLVKRMETAGFVLFGLEPGVFDFRTGQLLQCDGLFVRRSAIDGFDQRSRGH